MKNKMKTVENLEVGETLLVGIRKNAGGKFGVDIAEIIVPPRVNNEHNSLISLFNVDDERFNSGTPKARRLYFSGTALQLKNLLEIDVDQLTFKKVAKKSGKGDMMYAEVNQLNPEVNGKRLRVIVQESLSPLTKLQSEKPEETCKRTPRGEILLSEGRMIFSDLKLSQSETPEKLHKFIQHDEVRPVGTPITVGEKVEDEVEA